MNSLTYPGLTSSATTKSFRRAGWLAFGCSCASTCGFGAPLFPRMLLQFWKSHLEGGRSFRQTLASSRTAHRIVPSCREPRRFSPASLRLTHLCLTDNFRIEMPCLNGVTKENPGQGCRTRSADLSLFKSYLKIHEYHDVDSGHYSGYIVGE